MVYQHFVVFARMNPAIIPNSITEQQLLQFVPTAERTNHHILGLNIMNCSVFFLLLVS
jgi:hypothetical protein